MNPQSIVDTPCVLKNVFLRRLIAYNNNERYQSDCITIFNKPINSIYVYAW